MNLGGNRHTPIVIHAGTAARRYTSHMGNFDRFFEHIRVRADELGDKVREIIHEGNARRIIIKDDHGHTFLEIPITVAAVGVVLAPILAAVGAIATLVSHFEVVVERAREAEAGKSGHPAHGTDESVGAREEQVDMADTVPQRADAHGNKVEDIAGTGEHDSMGG